VGRVETVQRAWPETPWPAGAQRSKALSRPGLTVFANLSGVPVGLIASLRVARLGVRWVSRLVGTRATFLADSKAAALELAMDTAVAEVGLLTGHGETEAD
jgi:hypothetical protein